MANIKEYIICNNVKWVDVTAPASAEMETLSKEYQLSPYLIRDCMEPGHLPKYDKIDNVHFLIFRYFSHNFHKRIASIQDLTNKIAIFYTQDFLITIHKSEIRFLESIRKKYIDTGDCSTVEDVVVKICWDVLESYNNPAQRLMEQVDFYENKIFLKKGTKDLLETLYYIKQQASMSNKILMMMFELVNHIYINNTNEAALQDLRDQHIKVQTFYSLVLEDVSNLTSLYMSFSAQRTNEVVKVLTIFSVFFLPVTFISSIYGMNFTYMPELQQKWGYPVLLIVMAIITGCIYFYFKRKKWL